MNSEQIVVNRVSVTVHCQLSTSPPKPNFLFSHSENVRKNRTVILTRFPTFEAGVRG